MKYEILKNDAKTIANREVVRIKALISFGNVKSGDLGGFIESEENLSQNGNAWVDANAHVYGDACVFDNARVYGNACVFDRAHVYGNACVFGDTRVFDNARAFGDARVFENAQLFDYARVFDNAQVFGGARAFGDARVYGNARVNSTAPYIVLGCFGEDYRYLTVFKSGIINAGCFSGNFTEFKKAVKLKYGDDYGSYKNAILLIEAYLNIKQ